MNEENLIKRSPSEARKLGRAGGIASGKARRIKSRWRQLARDLLALKVQSPEIAAKLCKEYGINPADLTNEVALHLRQIEKAIRKADTAAYNAVLKAAGLADESPAPPSPGLQIVLQSVEAAEGLRRAIATGAQPAPPPSSE